MLGVPRAELAARRLQRLHGLDLRDGRGHLTGSVGLGDIFIIGAEHS